MMNFVQNLSGLEIVVFDGCVYFDDWLKAKGLLTQNSFREKAIINGYSDEAIDAELDSLENEFCEWAKENDLRVETC